MWKAVLKKQFVGSSQIEVNHRKCSMNSHGGHADFSRTYGWTTWNCLCEGLQKGCGKWNLNICLFWCWKKWDPCIVFFIICIFHESFEYHLVFDHASWPTHFMCLILIPNVRLSLPFAVWLLASKQLDGMLNTNMGHSRHLGHVVCNTAFNKLLMEVRSWKQGRENQPEARPPAETGAALAPGSWVCDNKGSSQAVTKTIGKRQKSNSFSNFYSASEMKGNHDFAHGGFFERVEILMSLRLQKKADLGQECREAAGERMKAWNGVYKSRCEINLLMEHVLGYLNIGKSLYTI